MRALVAAAAIFTLAALLALAASYTRSFTLNIRPTASWSAQPVSPTRSITPTLTPATAWWSAQPAAATRTYGYSVTADASWSTVCAASSSAPSFALQPAGAWSVERVCILTRARVRVAQSAGGRVLVNGTAVREIELGVGEYTVLLTAVPDVGYEFAGWRIENASGVYTLPHQTVTVTSCGNMSVQAVFKHTPVNWTQPDALLDVLAAPWKYAVLWTEAWGGRMFIGSLFTLASMVYVWWHTKEAVAAGLAGAICIAAIPVVPELRLAAYILLAFGSAAIIWRFLREVV